MARLFFERALLPDGWARDVRVQVAAGRIAAVEAGVRAEPEDERHGIGLPGLVNLHSHAFQRGMAGLAERRGPAADSFWTWRGVMYRFVAAMEPEDVEAVAAQAFVEMLEAGFTRVAEFHYLHHGRDGAPYADRAELAGRIAAAAAAAGIGLTLLPVFYAHGGFGGQAPTAGQARFVNGLDGYARLLEASRAAVAGVPGAVVGVAPHSLRAVTPAELRDVLGMAGGGPVHIHVAEQTAEVADCLAWSGQTPVAWLLDHAPVGPGWCLIHATHMTAAETAGLAASGAVAGLCPVTEANLGDGVFGAEAFVAAGGTYGVGTDSNVAISLAGELRALEYSQRLVRRSRNVLAGGEGRSTGRALFEAALVGGGQAAGGTAAGIAAGAAADLVSLDAGHVALAGCAGDAVLDAWVFAEERLVECVWVAGVRVVEGGRHRAAAGIGGRYRGVVRRLMG